MPAPSNYDSAGLFIQVDPNTLYADATGPMKTAAQGVADSIDTIVNTWNDLKLGWMGTSASEAQDFADRWTKAVQRLFGSGDQSDPGAFGRLVDAVQLASVNYGEAEDANVKMFRSLLDGLTGPPGTPGPPTRGVNDPPITENAPPPP
jgi:hypothetical protein